jgi:hypothetical protein
LNIAGSHTTPWKDIRQETGLCNVPASFFLRPYSPNSRWAEVLRLARIGRSIRKAALSKEIVHLWWHPHNFGCYMDQNLRFLRKVLQVFDRYRRSHGMRSLSMIEASTIASGNKSE